MAEKPSADEPSAERRASHLVPSERKGGLHVGLDPALTATGGVDGEKELAVPGPASATEPASWPEMPNAELSASAGPPAAVGQPSNLTTQTAPRCKRDSPPHWPVHSDTLESPLPSSSTIRGADATLEARPDSTASSQTLSVTSLVPTAACHFLHPSEQRELRKLLTSSDLASPGLVRGTDSSFDPPIGGLFSSAVADLGSTLLPRPIALIWGYTQSFEGLYSYAGDGLWPLFNSPSRALWACSNEPQPGQTANAAAVCIHLPLTAFGALLRSLRPPSPLQAGGDPARRTSRVVTQPSCPDPMVAVSVLVLLRPLRPGEPITQCYGSEYIRGYPIGEPAPELPPLPTVALLTSLLTSAGVTSRIEAVAAAFGNPLDDSAAEICTLVRRGLLTTHSPSVSFVLGLGSFLARETAFARYIIWIRRCFVTNRVPVADRSAMVLGPTPSVRQQRAHALARARYTGTVHLRLVVPRKRFYRPYRNFACYCSSGYCVDGVMATLEDVRSLREAAHYTALFQTTYGRDLLECCLAAPPTADIHFAGIGGMAYGAREAGFEVILADNVLQPDAIRMFGASRVTIADCLDSEAMAPRAEHPGLVFIQSSPPCTATSNLNYIRGRHSSSPSSSPSVILAARAQLDEIFSSTGVPGVLEGVNGASNLFPASRTWSMRASDFGSTSEDLHIFSTPPGYPLITEPHLRSSGAFIRNHTCSGNRSVVSKTDWFGRPLADPCCTAPASLKVALHSRSPPRGVRLSESAALAGFEPTHPSTWQGLVDALPPPLGVTVSAQMGYNAAHHALGHPLISQTASQLHPALLIQARALAMATHRPPLVTHLREIRPAFPHWRHAVLLLEPPGFKGFVGMLRSGRLSLPFVPLGPGVYAFETLLATALSDFGIRVPAPSLQFLGCTDDLLTAIFSSRVVNDDLLVRLPSSTSGVRPPLPEVSRQKHHPAYDLMTHAPSTHAAWDLESRYVLDHFDDYHRCPEDLLLAYAASVSTHLQHWADGTVVPLLRPPPPDTLETAPLAGFETNTEALDFAALASNPPVDTSQPATPSMHDDETTRELENKGVGEGDAAAPSDSAVFATEVVAAESAACDYALFRTSDGTLQAAKAILLIDDLVFAWKRLDSHTTDPFEDLDFPGGSRDQPDATIGDTLLREVEQEIHLSPDALQRLRELVIAHPNGCHERIVRDLPARNPTRDVDIHVWALRLDPSDRLSVGLTTGLPTSGDTEGTAAQFYPRNTVLESLSNSIPAYALACRRALAQLSVAETVASLSTKVATTVIAQGGCSPVLAFDIEAPLRPVARTLLLEPPPAFPRVPEPLADPAAREEHIIVDQANGGPPHLVLSSPGGGTASLRKALRIRLDTSATHRAACSSFFEARPAPVSSWTYCGCHSGCGVVWVGGDSRDVPSAFTRCREPFCAVASTQLARGFPSERIPSDWLLHPARAVLSIRASASAFELETRSLQDRISDGLSSLSAAARPLNPSSPSCRSPFSETELLQNLVSTLNLDAAAVLDRSLRGCDHSDLDPGLLTYLTGLLTLAASEFRGTLAKAISDGSRQPPSKKWTATRVTRGPLQFPLFRVRLKRVRGAAVASGDPLDDKARDLVFLSPSNVVIFIISTTATESTCFAAHASPLVSWPPRPSSATVFDPGVQWPPPSEAWIEIADTQALHMHLLAVLSLPSVDSHLLSSLSGCRLQSILDRDDDDPPQYRSAAWDRAAKPPDSLNAAQRRALDLQGPVELIRGPPGTGKSRVCASVLIHKVPTSSRSLACATGNKATDSLVEKLVQTGEPHLLVVGSRLRAGPFARSHLLSERVARDPAFVAASELASLAAARCSDLSVLIDSLPGSPSLDAVRSELLLLCTAARLEGDYAAAEYTRVRALVAEGIVAAARVLVCTTSSALKLRVRLESELKAEGVSEKVRGPLASHLEFKAALLDEAAATTELESLVPLLYGALGVVLVGDPSQLAPYSQLSDRRGQAADKMKISLMQRLMNVHHEHGSCVGEVIAGLSLLTEQYRMHPVLCDFVSKLFYSSQLTTGPSCVLARPLQAPVQILDCPGKLDTAANSFVNTVEVSAVSQLVTGLLQAGVPQSSICVLSFYTGQVRALTQRLGSRALVQTADSMQGSEADFVILSCVRCGSGSAGFLNCPQRVNVALSRARHGLIVVGDVAFLSGASPFWSKFIRLAGFTSRSNEVLSNLEASRCSHLLGPALPSEAPSEDNLSERSWFWRHILDAPALGWSAPVADLPRSHSRVYSSTFSADRFSSLALPLLLACQRELAALTDELGLDRNHITFTDGLTFDVDAVTASHIDWSARLVAFDRAPWPSNVRVTLAAALASSTVPEEQLLGSRLTPTIALLRCEFQTLPAAPPRSATPASSCFFTALDSVDSPPSHPTSAYVVDVYAESDIPAEFQRYAKSTDYDLDSEDEWLCACLTCTNLSPPPADERDSYCQLCGVCGSGRHACSHENGCEGLDCHPHSPPQPPSPPDTETDPTPRLENKGVGEGDAAAMVSVSCSTDSPASPETVSSQSPSGSTADSICSPCLAPADAMSWTRSVKPRSRTERWCNCKHGCIEEVSDEDEYCPSCGPGLLCACSNGFNGVFGRQGHCGCCCECDDCSTEIRSTPTVIAPSSLLATPPSTLQAVVVTRHRVHALLPPTIVKLLTLPVPLLPLDSLLQLAPAQEESWLSLPATVPTPVPTPPSTPVPTPPSTPLPTPPPTPPASHRPLGTTAEDELLLRRKLERLSHSDANLNRLRRTCIQGGTWPDTCTWLTEDGLQKLASDRADDAVFIEQMRALRSSSSPSVLLTAHNPGVARVDFKSHSTAPLRLLGATLVRGGAHISEDPHERPAPSDLLDPLTKILADTCGGEGLAGGIAVDRRNREAPNTFEICEGPQRCHSINGLSNPVFIRRFVRCHVCIDGAVFLLDNIPVVEGADMLLLGNQVNSALDAGYQYSGTDCTFTLQHPRGPVTAHSVCTNEFDTNDPASMESYFSDAPVMPLGFCSEPVAIAGRSRVRFKVMVPAGIPEGQNVVTSRITDPRWDDYGLRYNNTRTTVVAGHIIAEVENPHDHPITLGEMVPVCRFELTDWLPTDYTAEEAEKEVNVYPGMYTGPDSAERLPYLRRLLRKHLSILKRDLRTHFCHVAKAKIQIKADADPFRSHYRRLKPQEEEASAAAATENVRQGIMYHGESDWSAPMVAIKKSDGSIRTCSDLRGLNLRSLCTAHPLPDAERNLSRAAGRFFTAGDCLAGFNQVLLEESSQKYTALATPIGLLLSARLPFGWTGSPGFFAKLGLHIFDGVPAEVFVDDLLNSSWTFDQHCEDVDATWTRCSEGGLALKGKKVYLFWPELKYLGFLVSEKGRRPDPNRIKPILDWTLERMIEKPMERVKKWLGLIGQYQQFIPNFSLLTSPFWAAISGGVDARSSLRSLRSLVSFSMLRGLLGLCVAIAVPDFTKRFYIMTDAATMVGGCAVLYQIDSEDRPRPLGFWSKRFDKTEVGMCSRNAECFVVWAAVTKWKWAFKAGHVTIYTDHQSLKWLHTTVHKPNDMAITWALDVSREQPTIEYRPADHPEMQVVDAGGRFVAVTMSAATEMHQLITLRNTRVIEELSRGDLELTPPASDCTLDFPDDVLSSEEFGDPSTLVLMAAAGRPAPALVGVSTSVRFASGFVSSIQLKVALESSLILNVPVLQRLSFPAPITFEEAAPLLHRFDNRPAPLVSQVLQDWHTADCPPSVTCLVDATRLPSSVTHPRLGCDPSGDAVGFQALSTVLMTCRLDDTADLPPCLTQMHPPPLRLTHRIPQRPSQPAEVSRRKPRSGILIIHSTLGVLTLTSPTGIRYFPGGPSNPSSTYRHSACFHFSNLFGESALPLLAVLEGSRPRTLLRLGQTAYVAFSLPSQCRDAYLTTLICGHEGHALSMVPLPRLGDVSFLFQDDRAVARRLADAALGGSSIHQLLWVQTLRPSQSTVLATFSDRSIESSSADYDHAVRRRLALAARGGRSIHQVLWVPAAAPEGSTVLATYGERPAVDCSSSDPRGPKYICTDLALATWTALAAHVIAQDGHPRVLALDLEGLLHRFGFVEFIQLAFESGPLGGLPLIAVVDVRLLPAALGARSAIRGWLEDPSIVKVLHHCAGDSSALFHLFGIRLQSIFDTGTADCLARHAQHCATRGLSVVLHHWTGLELDKTVIAARTPEAFAVRPITPELFLYCYGDVLYCCQLYHVLSVKLRTLQCFELCRSFSEARAASLLLQAPTLRSVCIALCGNEGTGGEVVCSRSSMGDLQVPCGQVDSLLAATGRGTTRQVWGAEMGMPTTPVRAAINARLSKATRLDDVLVYTTYIGALDTAVTHALSVSFNGDTRSSDSLSFEYVSIGNLPSLCRSRRTDVLIAQWLLHQQRRRDELRSVKAGLHDALAAKAVLRNPVRALSGAGPALPPNTVLNTSLNTTANASCLLVHDGFLGVFLETGAARTVCLPTLRTIGNDGPGTAQRAFEQQFGKLNRLPGQPALSTFFNHAIQNPAHLATVRGVAVYGLRFQSLRYHATHFHAAFYFRRYLASIAAKFPAWRVHQLSGLRDSLAENSSIGQALRALTILDQEPACEPSPPPPAAEMEEPLQLTAGAGSTPNLLSPAEPLLQELSGDSPFDIEAHSALHDQVVASTSIHLLPPNESPREPPVASKEFDNSANLCLVTNRVGTPYPASVRYMDSPDGSTALDAPSSPQPPAAARYMDSLDGSTTSSTSDLASPPAAARYMDSPDGSPPVCPPSSLQDLPSSLFQHCCLGLRGVGLESLTHTWSSVDAEWVCDSNLDVFASQLAVQLTASADPFVMDLHSIVNGSPRYQGTDWTLLYNDRLHRWQLDHPVLPTLSGHDLPNSNYETQASPVGVPLWYDQGSRIAQPAVKVLISATKPTTDCKCPRQASKKGLEGGVPLQDPGTCRPHLGSQRAPPTKVCTLYHSSLLDLDDDTASHYSGELTADSPLLLVQVDHDELRLFDDPTHVSLATGPSAFDVDWKPFSASSSTLLLGSTSTDDLLESAGGSQLWLPIDTVLNSFVYTGQLQLAGTIAEAFDLLGLTRPSLVSSRLFSQPTPVSSSDHACVLVTHSSQLRSTGADELPDDSKGRSGWVEELPTPTPSAPNHPTPSPSMPSTAKADPAHPHRLPAVGDQPSKVWSSSSVLRAQLADPFIGKVHAFLLDNQLSSLSSPPTPSQKRLRSFARGCLIDQAGLVCVPSSAGCPEHLRVLIPSSFEAELFRNYHDRAGHMGVRATYKLIQRRWFVPRLVKKLRKWIINCGPCSRAHRPARPAGEATVPFRGTSPGQSYTTDVYTTGYECDGYDHIFIIVDDFSGWIRAIPLKGPGDTETLLRIWKYEITRNESLASVIKSDRGSPLVSLLYEAYCKAHSTEPRSGASGNHHSAAIAERLLQTLDRMLRKHRISTKDQRWYEYLIDLEIVFNQHGCGKGESPFYYNRLRDPFFAHDLATFGIDALRARVGELGALQDSYLTESVERAHRVWEAHQLELRVLTLRTQIRSNSKRDTQVHFKKNQRVMLRKRTIRGKWELPYYDEAYRIKQYSGKNTYELLDLHNNRIHKDIPADDLAPYPEMTNDGDGPLADDEFYVTTIKTRRLVAGDDGRPAFQYRFAFRNQRDANEDRWYFAEDVPQLHQMIRVYNTLINPISDVEATRIAAAPSLTAADVSRPARFKASSRVRTFMKKPDAPSTSTLPPTPEDADADADASADDADPPADDLPDSGESDAAADSPAFETDSDPELHVAPVTQCVKGTHVVIPWALYPRAECVELHGLGWEAVARGPPSKTGSVSLDYLCARNAEGRPYFTTLQLSQLQQLVEAPSSAAPSSAPASETPPTAPLPPEAPHSPDSPEPSPPPASSPAADAAPESSATDSSDESDSTQPPASLEPESLHSDDDCSSVDSASSTSADRGAPSLSQELARPSVGPFGTRPRPRPTRRGPQLQYEFSRPSAYDDSKRAWLTREQLTGVESQLADDYDSQIGAVLVTSSQPLSRTIARHKKHLARSLNRLAARLGQLPRQHKQRHK